MIGEQGGNNADAEWLAGILGRRWNRPMGLQDGCKRGCSRKTMSLTARY